MKVLAIPSVLTLLLFAGSVQADDKDGWIQLWDGKTFDNWKASENKDAWSIEDGAIVAKGERSHLFYVGEAAPFDDFEFHAEVLTKPNSNAGIYFHTTYQDEGWPKAGFEAQVNNSYKNDPKRTGSLYGVENVLEAPAEDNEWFDYDIRVKGNRITISIDGETVVDYEQPADAKAGSDFARVLGEGTFALQAHDPHSEVHFRNLRARKLN